MSEPPGGSILRDSAGNPTGLLLAKPNAAILYATLAKGRQHLVVRAFDETGQGQPERPDTVWNFAGYLCTAWHHVHVLVE